MHELAYRFYSHRFKLVSVELNAGASQVFSFLITHNVLEKASNISLSLSPYFIEAGGQATRSVSQSENQLSL